MRLLNIQPKVFGKEGRIQSIRISLQLKKIFWRSFVLRMRVRQLLIVTTAECSIPHMYENTNRAKTSLFVADSCILNIYHSSRSSWYSAWLPTPPPSCAATGILSIPQSHSLSNPRRDGLDLSPCGHKSSFSTRNTRQISEFAHI